MIRLVALMSFFCIPFLSIAQGDFYPVKVVMKDNVILNGKMNGKFLPFNPTVIEFVSDDMITKMTYSPKEVRYFILNKVDTFESYTVQTDGSGKHKQYGTIKSGKVEAPILEDLFLRKLVGEDYVSLYEYETPELFRYFIKVKANDSLEELKIYQKIDIEAPTTLVTNNDYVVKLKKLASIKENQLLISKISKLDYNETALSNIILELNGVLNGKSLIDSKRKQKMNTYVGTFCQYNIFHLSHPFSNFDVKSNGSASAGMLFGFELFDYKVIDNKKMNFEFEVNQIRFKPKGIVENSFFSEKRWHDMIGWNLSVSVNYMRRVYKHQKANVFLGLGFGGTLFASTRNQSGFTREYLTMNIEPNTQIQKYKPKSDIFVFVPARVLIDLNQSNFDFFIKSNYMVGKHTFLGHHFFNTRTSLQVFNVQFGLLYTFNKG